MKIRITAKTLKAHTLFTNKSLRLPIILGRGTKGILSIHPLRVKDGHVRIMPGPKKSVEIEVVGTGQVQTLSLPCRIALADDMMLDLSEDADAFERLWIANGALTSRKLVLFTLAGCVVLSFLNWALLGKSGFTLLGYSLGFPIGVLLASLFLGAVLSIPGWLIQGEFRPRPLVNGFAASTMIGALLAFVDPWTVVPFAGLLFLLLAAILQGAATFISLFVFLRSMFSDSWSLAVGRSSMVFAILLAIATGWRAGTSDGSRKEWQNIFQSVEPRVAGFVSGKTVDASQFSKDFLKAAATDTSSRSPASVEGD